METGLEYGLIGAKLGHSFSPEIHAKIGHYPYELRELSPEGVHQLLEERTFQGLNVTIPYKELCWMKFPTEPERSEPSTPL